MQDATLPDFVLKHHAAAGMYAERADLLAVYEEVYASQLSNPFFAPSRFWERLESYAKWPGFSLVTGHVEGNLVGYTLGYTLPKGSVWWRGFWGHAEAGLLEEDGRRTFAVTQLMVLPSWRRRGIARALHDELLSGRVEARATLLVKPDNEPARSAYLSWGWDVFGQVQPFDDAPVYDALMRQRPSS